MTPARLCARRDDALRPRITASRALPGVRAGSALVSIGRRLLAIQDDAFAAVWIDPIARRIELLKLRGLGEPLDKAGKPDFEAAFVHDDSVWILGSGSRPNRCHVARIDVATGAAPLVEARALYAAVARAVAGPANVEGAAITEGSLRLFQRGPGRGSGGNFLLDFDARVLSGAPPALRAVTACDLGTLAGLQLGFTDAATLPSGRTIYLAVAEDTADAIADGAVAGCAVGILEGTAMRWAPLLEPDGRPSVRKAEGLALDPDGKAGWLLTDPDDPRRPAELCRMELAGA